MFLLWQVEVGLIFAPSFFSYISSFLILPFLAICMLIDKPISYLIAKFHRILFAAKIVRTIFLNLPLQLQGAIVVSALFSPIRRLLPVAMLVIKCVF
jgi:hypothetical protein